MFNSATFADRFARFFKKFRERNPALNNLLSHARLHRWLILVLSSFILTILLTPQVRFQHPAYKLGDIADSKIKADRDLLVENRAATAQKRLEASNEIASIYDFDSEAASQILANLANAFAMMKEIGAGKISVPSKEPRDGLGPIKKYFESTVGVSLSTEEFQILHQNKFSPAIAARIGDLITTSYHNRIITNVTFLQQEKDKGIIIRDVRNQTESELTSLSTIRHIRDVEAAMTRMADRNRERGGTDINKVVLSLAVKLIRPNLMFNRDATESKKLGASKDVKPVLSKVQKNEMLVREGEKITPAVLDKLEAHYLLKGDNRLSKYLIFTGMFFTIAFLGIILYYYGNKLLKNDKVDLLFLSVVTVGQIIIVRAGIFIAGAITEAFPALPYEAFIYPIPFSAATMLVSLLINRNLAFILSIILSLMVAFLFDGRLALFIYSFLGSAVASYCIVDCKKRTAFLKVGLFLGLINMGAIFFVGLIYENVFRLHTLISLGTGFLGGIVSGILVAGVAPLMEFLFRYTTDIKLLELANLNQPIFQKMLMEAPGTYHHSIIVASMVEAAAESIGANSLLAKVSAYYHDLGKMKKPQYFIENQFNSENKHNKLSPKMSSLVIISHIKDGYELALKLKVGKEIANIIKEHHGTGLVSYFYEKAKRDKDPSIRSLLESDFRYPGPKPQTREAGLVLLGDVLEASSRTLTNPTPSRIKTLVRERIDGVLSDGQLDECELTLHDLNKIAENFTMILNGIFHQRIDYPDLTTNEQNGTRKENSHPSVDRRPAEKNKNRPATAAAGGA